MAMMAQMIFMMTIGALIYHSLALPTPDEERYFNKDYNRDLMSWLAAVQHPTQQYFNPCKYYALNSLADPMPKRNSELINSLLSLPKSMNDAGK